MVDVDKGTCSAEGCDRPAKKRGLCGRDYQRLRMHGSTDDPRRSAEQRFWAKVDKRGADECWPWTAAKMENGYGSFGVGRTTVYAHRFAYELLIGPIPEGLVLDHLCRMRHCVNVAHLEAVTVRKNLMRGEGLAARNVRKTHCPDGHPYDAANTYYVLQRYCRACSRARALAYYRRKRVQG